MTDAATDARVASFSSSDLADWRAYERVRLRGRYNMFDPRARRATGLNKDRYSFVMKNFGALRDAIVKDTQT